MKIIEIKNVTKKYASHVALDNVSFPIYQGTVFGLLGPNGSGKTSLLRIINQITAPDEGEIYFYGKPLLTSDIAKIGYLPEERGLYKKMKVAEQALYLAQLKGIPKTEAKKRLDFWFERFEIQNWKNKRVEELSKGMQQKIQFITTIIHQPQLLILDEPFSGFDPINANLLKNEILELKKQGTTIILSTHNMTSVEEICDDIVLINHSKKILEGNLADIKQQFKQNKFVVKMQGVNNECDIRNDGFVLDDVKIENTVTTFYISLREQFLPNQLLTYFMNFGQVVDFKELLPTMNDVFIQAVNDNQLKNGQN